MLHKIKFSQHQVVVGALHQWAISLKKMVNLSYFQYYLTNNQLYFKINNVYLPRS